MEETAKELLEGMIERYHIGKKPLSRLLGWGDTTVLRYIDGIEPNPEFARRITMLAKNPWLYLETLENNKEKLTEIAYRKSKKAVYEEIFCDRSTEAIQYVINLAEGDIAPYRVIAVLYYAQVCSLVLRGTPIFEERVDFSLEEQRIYPRLYEQMKRFGIHGEILPENLSLSEREQEYLQQVYHVLNGYSPNAIRMLLARAKRRTRKSLKEGADYVSAIELKHQYEDSMKKSGIQTPGDLKLFLSEALKRSEG